MCSQTCSIFSSNFNRLTAIWMGHFSTHRFGELKGHGSLGWAHSIARQWVPISSIFYTYSLSVTIFELFSWLQQRFRPSVRPDTMTNTAREATASSSGKNHRYTLHSVTQHATRVVPMCPKQIEGTRHRLLSACTTCVFIKILIQPPQC